MLWLLRTPPRPDHVGVRYHGVVFAHDLSPDKRSDRVIADARDVTFTLVDGEVDEANAGAGFADND